MAPFTYSSLVTALTVALVQAPSPYTALPTDYAALVPQAVSQGEGRIYREVPMLGTRKTDSTLSTSGSARTISLSGMTLPIIVPEGVALVVSGTAYPFDLASLDIIDQFWPTSTLTLAPNLADWIGRYWAMLDDHTIVVCPTPDATYTANITGIFQPTALSNSNQNSYLATIYPDLLFASCMVWLTGTILRNFGSQSDNPQQALSWEKTYQDLLTSTKAEEARRRGLKPNVGA